MIFRGLFVAVEANALCLPLVLERELGMGTVGRKAPEGSSRIPRGPAWRVWLGWGSGV